MRISDWSSDVCSSDLGYATIANGGFMIDPYLITEVRDVDGKVLYAATPKHACLDCSVTSPDAVPGDTVAAPPRSEEHTSELQSLMRISYAVFCLKKKTNQQQLTYRRCLSSHLPNSTISSRQHPATP